jgi:hypothetical protein
VPSFSPSKSTFVASFGFACSSSSDACLVRRLGKAYRTSHHTFCETRSRCLCLNILADDMAHAECQAKVSSVRRPNTEAHFLQE